MRIKHFYKYRKFNEYAKQIILDGIVYVPSPLEFNDPFDCRIPIIPDGTEHDFKNLLINYLEKKYTELSVQELNQLVKRKLAEGVHKNSLIMKQKLDEAIRIQLKKNRGLLFK